MLLNVTQITFDLKYRYDSPLITSEVSAARTQALPAALTPLGPQTLTSLQPLPVHPSHPGPTHQTKYRVHYVLPTETQHIYYLI